MADHARGERLRTLRNERRLNQEDAAHEIGVSTKTLRTWEKGGPIRWDNAKAAATFYEVEPESLVSREPGDLSDALSEAEPASPAKLEEMLQEILDQQAQLLADVSQVRSEQERQLPLLERLSRGRAAKRK